MGKMERKFLLLSLLSLVKSEFFSEDSQETKIFNEAKNISPENQMQSVSLRDKIPVHLAQPRPMGPQNLDQNAMLGLFKNVFDFISDFNVDCGNTECYQELMHVQTCRKTLNVNCAYNTYVTDVFECRVKKEVRNQHEIHLNQNVTQLEEENFSRQNELNATQTNQNSQTAALEQKISEISQNCSSNTKTMLNNMNDLKNNLTDLGQVHAECVANLTSSVSQLASLNSGLSLAGFGTVLILMLSGIALLSLGGGGGYFYARKKFRKAETVIVHSNSDKPDGRIESPAVQKFQKTLAQSQAASTYSTASAGHDNRPQQLVITLQNDGFPGRAFAGTPTGTRLYTDEPPAYQESEEEEEIRAYKEKIRRLRRRHELEKNSLQRGESAFD